MRATAVISTWTMVHGSMGGRSTAPYRLPDLGCHADATGPLKGTRRQGGAHGPQRAVAVGGGRRYVARVATQAVAEHLSA